MISYDRRNLPGDVVAGLTLWAVLAAQALAYARLAHATPTAGLVTAIAGAALYTAFGSSIRISIGPAGGIAAIVGAAMVAVPAAMLGASIAAVTLMAAAFLFVAGLFKVTFLTRLFPRRCSSVTSPERSARSSSDRPRIYSQGARRRSSWGAFRSPSSRR